ncbi:hypothetical protein BWQ96_07521 [Gracilariopsis chorda]|uniref:Uncharacterized protein n=1 Tax=Gracilariopsis chorda TaxID=448386 RepID=A0A2V3IKU5_9FLOR|nr:hypothetical protein BWQ96_07521 [Gracilariopsis chorda]|eukprot:PXF42706.1 hypothetical protein BWQ96_07521 [Gracilariopsis chorda]
MSNQSLRMQLLEMEPAAVSSEFRTKVSQDLYKVPSAVELPCELCDEFSTGLIRKKARLLYLFGCHIERGAGLLAKIRDELLDSPNPDNGISFETAAQITHLACELNRRMFRLWSILAQEWDLFVDVSIGSDKRAESEHVLRDESPSTR